MTCFFKLTAEVLTKKDEVSLKMSNFDQTAVDLNSYKNTHNSNFVNVI